MTIPVPAAIAILALLFVLALMLASLLSAGERTQADIWRQQWAASCDAVRQLTLDVTTARGERDRARATAVYLEHRLAEIADVADRQLTATRTRYAAGHPRPGDNVLDAFAGAVYMIANDLTDPDDPDRTGAPPR